MADDSQKQDSPSQGDEDQQVAVPYVPPPPPQETSQKKFKSPVTNGVIAAFVILLGGVMAYNYVGHQLTKISGSSVEVTVTPTPSVIPSVTTTHNP